MIREFISDEEGQDLVEYILLLGFIALAAAGILIGMSSSTSTLWSITNSRLNNANN